MFGFDLIEAVFGDMTLAARVAHILLGLAAIYCAIKTITTAKRRPSPGCREGQT
jgi:uncharacterized membrane protein YuzA (DUF378 family)